MRYAVIVGCVLAGAFGTGCGDISVIRSDGGAGAGSDGGRGGGDGGRGGSAAGNAGGGAGTGTAGSAVGTAGTGAAGTGAGGVSGPGTAGAGGGTAGAAGTGTAGAAGTGTAGAGGRGGAAGTGPAGAGGGGRGGGAAGSVAGTAGTGTAGAGGRGGGAGNAAGAGGGGAAGCRRELLTNGDFELARSSWSEAPQGIRLVRRVDEADVASHQVTGQSGSYVLRLGADSDNYVVHYAEQYVNIPVGALELTISGYLQVRTEEPPDDIYDMAYVLLFNEATPASPFFSSSPRWTNLTQARPWVPFSYSLNASSLAGRQMVFRVYADLDASVPTYFYFDTLSVAVTRCAP